MDLTDFDLNIINKFTKFFTDYIDSGFGLIQSDVAYLTTILVVIDITLVGVFRALLHDVYLPVAYARKVLYIGFFAFLINNYKNLVNIVYMSFATLGLKATNASMNPESLLEPGFIAIAGFKAGWPILSELGKIFSSLSAFYSLPSILILSATYLIILAAFFWLAVELFITIIEFKLTALIGFILVPFALFKQTIFLADRVLTNVMNAGVKLMVLGIIVGISSTIFDQLILKENEVTLERSLSLALGALCILALARTVPALARGMIMGTPQLGAHDAYNAAKSATGNIRTVTAMGGRVVGAGTATVGTGAFLGGAGAGAYRSGGVRGVGSTLSQGAWKGVKWTANPVSQSYKKGHSFGEDSAKGQATSWGWSKDKERIQFIRRKK